jgi:hypothetical protein
MFFKMKRLLASLPMMLCCLPVFALPTKLSHTDEVGAFKAAGYRLSGNQWRKCDDPTPSYDSGTIEKVLDANGDGLPEAVITEGSSFCYGNTGAAYSLVSKQADGRWTLMTEGSGDLNFLSSKGVGGWPDIEIGGPGFCFLVERWNGQKYVSHRHQYEGKPCRPK